MKLSPNLLLYTLSYGVSVVATSSTIAQVFVHDPNTASVSAPEQPTVLADTARLIFAQRLGLSSFHALQDVNEEEIRHINQYAVPQRKLFGHESLTKRSQAIVIIEDAERPEGRIADARLPFARIRANNSHYRY